MTKTSVAQNGCHSVTWHGAHCRRLFPFGLALHRYFEEISVFSSYYVVVSGGQRPTWQLPAASRRHCRHGIWICMQDLDLSLGIDAKSPSRRNLRHPCQNRNSMRSGLTMNDDGSFHQRVNAGCRLLDGVQTTSFGPIRLRKFKVVVAFAVAFGFALCLCLPTP